VRCPQVGQIVRHDKHATAVEGQGVISIWDWRSGRYG
jgi:hypothetical protein